MIHTGSRPIAARPLTLWINRLDRLAQDMQAPRWLHCLHNNCDEWFCANGVLALIAAEQGIVDTCIGNEPLVGYGHAGDWSYQSLPPAVLAWAGITRALEKQIVDLNDAGQPFAAIARHIERAAPA